MQLDRKTRKLLISNKTHHLKTDVYRLYLSKISVARVMNVLVSTYTRKYAKNRKTETVPNWFEDKLLPVIDNNKLIYYGTSQCK